MKKGVPLLAAEGGGKLYTKSFDEKGLFILLFSVFLSGG